MSDPRRDADLTDQELVDRFNRRYFGGRFAGVTVARLPRVEAEGRLAAGVWRPATRTIEILETTKPEGRSLLILHEMCHINLTGPFMHGEDWLLRMDRLAKRGVPGAAAEAAEYRCGSSEILMRRQQFPTAVAAAIQSVAEKNVNASFDEAIQIVVAAHLDLRSTEVLGRLVPDAKRQWETAVANVRRWRENSELLQTLLPPKRMGPLEAPALRIPADVRVAVGRAVNQAVGALGIDAPSVRYFIVGNRYDFDPSRDKPDIALAVLNAGYSDRLYGKACSGPPETIWIRAGLSLDATVLIVFHECRHLQQATTRRPDGASSKAGDEDDANGYTWAAAAEYGIPEDRVARVRAELKWSLGGDDGFTD
jgi:hypothetical protein